MEDHGFEQIKICERLRYEGVSVLNIYLSFPEYGIFREIAENAREWAKNTLYGALCREYEADVDPQKRFKFGCEYQFVCGIRFFGDGFISAKIDASLKDRRTRRIRAENTYGLVIRESDGALLPIEAVADKKTVGNYRKSRGESFYLRDGGLFMLSREGERLLLDSVVDLWGF